jgi:hypothetical protein
MFQFTAAITLAFLVVTSYAGGLEKQWTKTKVEGETVPSVTFKTRVRTDELTENPFDWKDLTSEDYFKGKRTVVFALPGAFTPTCKLVYRSSSLVIQKTDVSCPNACSVTQAPRHIFQDTTNFTT